jgi:hypothetical protein
LSGDPNVGLLKPNERHPPASRARRRKQRAQTLFNAKKKKNAPCYEPSLHQAKIFKNERMQRSLNSAMQPPPRPRPKK